MIWRFLYNVIFIPLGWLGFQIYGLLNDKARRGIAGRKKLFEWLEEEARQRLHPGCERVWLHVASMGEFEQAKPIIVALRNRHPSIQIIVSFFSPSGFEHSKNYRLADIITYLPFDSRENAQRFIECIRPTAAIFIRYDLWANHIWALRDAGIPIFLVCATLKTDQIKRTFFLRGFFYSIYDALTHIFTISSEDAEAFAKLRLKNASVEILGDTRYDQVVQRSVESMERRILPEQIVQHRKVILIGSSWEDDEDVLLPACQVILQQHPEILIIVVPHEPTVETIERIEQTIAVDSDVIRLSNLQEYQREHYIIVDSVGVLMPLYRYASIAYVGGGFHQGIHNVLEPAVYGVPVLVGPAHQNSQEARAMVNGGGAIVVDDRENAIQILNVFVSDEQKRNAMGKMAREFVCSRTGATERFLMYFDRVIQPTTKELPK